MPIRYNYANETFEPRYGHAVGHDPCDEQLFELVNL